MKWTEINKENGYRRVSIEADWSEIAADYDDVVAEYAKIRVPGFRLGRVLHGVIERIFSREITDELSRRCGRRLGAEALQQAGVEPLNLSNYRVSCVKRRNPFAAQHAIGRNVMKKKVIHIILQARGET